jgi:UDP-3-O-[3-hydroxymyristoyl] glucosamine N-acyltransferase
MLSLAELAQALGTKCVAHNLQPNPEANPQIARVSSLDSANAASLVFAETAETLEAAIRSAAGAVVTSPALVAAITAPAKPLLIAEQPRLTFARAARLLRAGYEPCGIHPTASVSATAKIGDDVSIDPYAVLGEFVRVGARTRIGAGCMIADGVAIGADCTLYPRVVIYSGVEIGNRVTLHAGCVLGSDGFGYVRDAKTGVYTQFPQQGTLVVEDEVEIGANTTIDRGALEETRIARGTKLDNLVHIGHNVRIGHNVVIAAQTGISGSSAVGDGAVLGGQVGMGEHAEVGEGVILGGGAGVLSRKKLRGAGEVFWGRPALPLRAYLKSLAALARLARKTKA